MRSALDQFLSDASEENPILAAAAERKRRRGPGRAPPIPGQVISGDHVPIWVPPQTLLGPSEDDDLLVDDEGELIEPPANAIGWRVLWRVNAASPWREFRKRGVPLILELFVRRHEFEYAIGSHPGEFHLQVIDDSGRVLRFRGIDVERDQRR